MVESERQLYLRYLFANGSYGAIEFERVGIMTDFEYKYYIRKEYTEVSELHKGSEQPVIIQQVPQQTEPAAGEEPQNGQEEKEGVNNAS